MFLVAELLMLLVFLSFGNGCVFIIFMEKLGLVYDVRLPRTVAEREDLDRVN